MTDRKIFDADIKGVTVKIRELTETQVALLARAASRLQRAADSSNPIGAFDHVGQMLDIIESIIVEQSDKAEISRLMTIGELEVADLIDALSAASEPVVKAAAKPRVRRGQAK